MLFKTVAEILLMSQIASVFDKFIDLFMFNFKILFRTFLFLSFIIPCTALSQSLAKVHFSTLYGLRTDSLTLSDSTGLSIKREKPVLSFRLDEK